MIARRTFIAGLGSAAGSSVIWPLAARGQQTQMPTIGFLNSGSPEPFAPYLAAFRNGLGDSGFVEGRNVLIEARWAEGQFDRLPAQAADLVRRQVSVIATGATAAALAAKAATTAIPIVFNLGSDPVKLGLVASLNRPGANVTGVTWLANQLGAKRMELLHQLVPAAATIALLVNPANPNTEFEAGDTLAAARAIGKQVTVYDARDEQEMEATFVKLERQRPDALIVAGDPFFDAQRAQLVALETRYRLPTLYFLDGFVRIGGLASYSASITESYRQVGSYAGRILRGEKPSNLPVMQPTKFELIINLKTAKALGLTVPASMLALADEVIE